MAIDANDPSFDINVCWTKGEDNIRFFASCNESVDWGI